MGGEIQIDAESESKKEEIYYQILLAMGSSGPVPQLQNYFSVMDYGSVSVRLPSYSYSFIEASHSFLTFLKLLRIALSNSAATWQFSRVRFPPIPLGKINKS